MYCPYLRGKQFELLALRDFSSENPQNKKILPIIEPVKIQLNGLKSALGSMCKNGMKFALILNPLDGDFSNPNVSNDIIETIDSLKDNEELSWVPAYIYRNDPQSLLSHAEKNGLDQLMIVFPSGADTNDATLMDFLADKKVSYIVSGNLSSSRSTKSKLLRLGKSLISLEDRFNSQDKNADYALHDDEFFSEDFAFYKDDRLAGFADYTTLPKDFTEGGMLPYAIAIHLTYTKSEDQIFVHHFVSENNRDQSNIQGKFHEAAIKIEPFVEQNAIPRTNSISELIAKGSSEDGYPGLGYIKKLSIKNHLELINSLIPE